MEGEWFSMTGKLQWAIIAMDDCARKHEETKTVRQFIENGLHLQCRQKGNRNTAIKAKIRKIEKLNA